jgi:lysophospholipase L1-like esterase
MSPSGDIVVETWTENSVSSGSKIETLTSAVAPNKSVVVKPTQNASYARIFHNISTGTGLFSIFDISNTLAEDVDRIYEDLETLDISLYNQPKTFSFYTGNENRVVSYSIVAGHEYIIENVGEKNIALYTYSASTYPDGQDIETITSGLGQGQTIRFKASQNASYIRGFHPNYNSADKFTIYDSSTFEQKIEDAANPPTSAELLFWGDSLTMGAGGGGVTYPGTCARELGGLTFLNCGVGGETANTISARQGGNSVVIPAGAVNGDYPVLYDIFGHAIEPLVQNNDGSGSAAYLYIGNDKCNIAWDGEKYTISGYTGETSDYAMIGRFAGSEYTGNVVVIFVGQNGAYVEGLTNIDPYISIIDSMIAHVNHGNYVIVGLTSGTASSRHDMEVRYLQEYGNKYFNARDMLVKYGLVINGITPTSQDQTDIASGKVPTSLLSDEIHLNQYGYTALGIMVADKINGLGYLK